MAREPVLVEMRELGLDSGWDALGHSTNLLEEYPAAAGGRSGAIGFSRRPEAACRMAAAGRGIVKAASWSELEACVFNLPDDERKVAAAESVIEPAAGGGKGKPAAGGGKGKPAAESIIEPAAGGGKGKQAAGGGKAKPAGPRRTKLVPVGQDYIDSIKEYRASIPRRTGPVWHAETMARIYKDRPEALERSRSHHAKVAAIFKSMEERDDEILKQYNAGGAAFMEIEVSDDV